MVAVTGGGPLLEGLRVVELGRRVAAPLAGMLLAEQGAEVVRVVVPEPGGLDPVLAALLARGKVEVELDPGAEAGRAVLGRLLAQADVVIDGLGPRRLGRFGIDFEALRAGGNPGLVSCSVTAFPPDDPRGELPDHEAVAGAAGCLYDKPLGPPRFHGLTVGSVMAALHAANGIMAALIARARAGRGQHVETSLLGANLFAQVLQILVKCGMPRGFLPLKMVGTPFMSPWLCRDDRHIYLHITLPAHNARILELLEANGCAAEVRRLRRILSAETARDPSQVKSIAEAKRIRRAYARIFRTRTANEWERLLGGELCCIKVRTAEEWLDDSLAAGMTDVCEIDDPVFGALRAPGPTVSSPEHPPRLSARTRDATAEDTAVRWEAEPQPQTVASASESELRHPLAGIRVLDLSRIIAGPCAARVLAELGAEVLSVQNPTSLDWALSFHLVFNAGKKSATFDLTGDDGKRKLSALIDAYAPDVLIQNYRHLDVARAIGVGPESMRARSPRLVYTHLNAYGNEGGWRDRPGFEQVVQAVTGIQLTYGGGVRPRLLPAPIIDIGSGLAGAFATLLGLYHRRRTGEGLFANTHLTSAAVLFQLEQLAASQRRTVLSRARGDVSCEPWREIVAGVVRTLDVWACVAGPRDEVDAWLRRSGFRGLAEGGEALARARLWTRTLAHWRSTLPKSGTVTILPCQTARRLARDLARLDAHSQPLVRKRRFPGVAAPIAFVRMPLALSLTPLATVTPPPMRGADTEEVLALIGERAPDGGGVVAYPANKPLLLWLSSLVRWGYFAWRSGNI